MANETARLDALKKVLGSKDKFPYLATDLVNIRYITGFTGTYARLVVDENKSYLISDSRYEEYARAILPGPIEFILQGNNPFAALKKALAGMKKRRLFVEEHNMPLSYFLSIKKELRGVTVIPGGDEINRIRMIKDDDEIGCLREAARITDNCMSHLAGFIKPGMIEWDVAVEIEFFFRRNGCRKSSFDAIVASGGGSSMPHYETSMAKKILNDDVIIIDMGCEYRGYNSDLTRTIFMGSVDSFLREIYSIVRDAQAKAVSLAGPGVTTGRLDREARDYIRKKGFGKHFGHSLGHGLGLEVHELPAVKAGNIRLKKNMVITIEPGIYLPQRGGVRIEDMVLITENGCEALTRFSRDFVVI